MKKNGEKVQWDVKRRITINHAFLAEKASFTDDPENHEFESIQPNENPSNNNCETDTDVGVIETDIDVGIIETDINVGHNYKPLTENIELQPDANAVIVSSLNSLELSRNLKLKISKNHSAEKIDSAVERTLKWKSRPSDEVGIMSALKKFDEWKDAPTHAEKSESNLKYLQSLNHLDNTKIGIIYVTVGNKYIEFHLGSNANTFHIDDADFKKNTAEYLEYVYSQAEKK